MSVNWIITEQNVTVNYDNQTHIVKRSDALAVDLIKAIKESRFDDIPNLVSVAQAMEHKSKGDIVVRDGEIFVKGVKVPAELARKIRSFIDEGLPYQPLIKFAEKLQENPSFRAVNELFQFLEKNDHPLTETGNFIAYKRVQGNFKDIHSGTFDNSPGNVVKVHRNQVDEDSSQTCSHGLHVANWDYAHTQFASHDPSTDIMLEVEVSPADVVAIPSDYNQSKMRVCEYRVIGVVKTEYKGSSLRMVNPAVPINEVDEEKPCLGCGAYAVDKITGVCDMCDHEKLEEEAQCQECLEYFPPSELEDDLCSACEDNTEYCEECGGRRDYYTFGYDCECKEEEEEEDIYPFEDELKGE